MKKSAKLLAITLSILMALAMGLSACGAKGGEEGQNAAMNFIGNYSCDRANIYIGCDENNTVMATVTWGASAWENSAWTMSGTFDEKTLTFEYNDCVRTNYEYGENGEVKSEEEVYNSGHGSMTFAEGDPLTLTWKDDQENQADGMVFEYTGETPEEGSNAGVPNPWSDVDSGEEAAEGAGLELFEVPEGVEISLGEIEVKQYRCMDGLAEAIIEFPAVEMTIRKGNDKSLESAKGDISGDYNEYKESWTQNIKGLEVNCSGNEKGKATKTVWTVDDVDYSITVLGLGGDENFGLSEDDLNSIINGLQ